MSWQKYFDRIVLINLPMRNDKFLASIEQLEKYGIDVELVSAIKRDSGAEGLRETMIKLFKDCLERGIENILVFEDDLDIIDESINYYMDKIVKQLPNNYHLLYLGCQPSKGLTHFYSPNLLPISGGYATHAVAYSRKAMEMCVNMNMQSPIDNWIVDNIQIYGNCYVTYPFLVSQREELSDIGGLVINWKPFLEHKYNRAVNELITQQARQN